MGWGTYYKHEGYLSHIAKDTVESEIEDCTSRIDLAFREILAYMAATPPEYDTDCEGEKIPYPEVLAMKVQAFKESLIEDISLQTRLQECLDVMIESPEDVTEG